MSRKRQSNKRQELNNANIALFQNGKAMEEGRKIKHWTTHDIKSIRPLTPSQEDVFHSWFNKEHICLHGSAGTGKTFLGLYLALNEVLQKNQHKIIIVRSAVATREVGFLPGILEEKIAQYEIPYQAILTELFGKDSTYNDMKDAKIIEFIPTSFIRGLTWDNAVVIVDEFQNMQMQEIDSVLTRVGKNTRVILCGDIKRQCDLKQEQTCANRLLNIIKKMDDFADVNFTHHDIVRSEFVKEWIIASEQLDINR